MSGVNCAPGGSAARIRARYSSAAAVVLTGGTRLGITTARAKRAALNGSTARSSPPSRRCRCQSSGRRMTSASTLATLQRVQQITAQQQLEREAHAEAGDVGAHVRQSAAARGGRQIHVRPGDVRRHETRQEARGEDVIALAVARALHDFGYPALELRIVVRLAREVPDALAAGPSEA